MSTVDEELTRRLHQPEGPVETDRLVEELRSRRARRTVLRRVQAGVLAVAVLAATAGGFVHLFAMGPDGSDPRQITDFGTDDTSPAVSPGGTTIAFVHQLEDVSPALATIPIGGGVVTWLTDRDLFVTDGPSWSPDGTRIAFAAQDGHGQRIFVVNADGSDPHAITDDRVYWAEGPAWSPDGRTIAFSASPISGDEEPSVWDVYTVGVDGRGLVNVTDSPDVAADEAAPSWSPDGARLAFSRTDLETQTIVIRTLNSGEETVITDGPIDGSPAWSPDGEWIAFDRAGFQDEPGQHPAHSDIWRVRPDGTDPQRLTHVGAFAPAWQPLPVGQPSPSPTAQAEPSPTTQPSLSPNPEAIEIGLPFRLCHATRLDGVEFLGDGGRGIAWVGIRVRDDGTCAPLGAVTHAVVAADVHGDELADAWWDGIEQCLACAPYDSTDLDADGDDELVVVESRSSTPIFLVLTILRGGSAEPELAPVVVAPPGHEAAAHPAGEPLRISSGGDEGFAAWVGCERFPSDQVSEPVMVLTWRDHPIEGDGPVEVHETRLTFDDAIATVVGARDDTLPSGSEVSGVSDEPACGVDWQLWG